MEGTWQLQEAKRKLSAVVDAAVSGGPQSHYASRC
jgi:prevent-host-death family protein